MNELHLQNQRHMLCEKAKYIKLIDVYRMMPYVQSLTTRKAIQYGFWDTYMCSKHTKACQLITSTK